MERTRSKNYLEPYATGEDSDLTEFITHLVKQILIFVVFFVFSILGCLGYWLYYCCHCM